MIYDVKGHISHIIKSPFTVYDWERSNVYAKLHMTKIMKTPLPQHSQLISSRRSVESYMSDLRQKSITYRKYSFAKENITQIELKKDMQDKDRLEYMYHIMRFLIVNFMKVYKKQNAPFSKELLKEFFETTGMDAAHINFFYKISKRKLEQKETVKKKDILKLQKFLHEFIDMHNKVFFKESKKIIFVRHQETALNKPGIFIGQKTDVGILPNMHHEKLLRLQALANDCGMVYTSQMRRAIETSKEIVKGSDGEIIINSLLNEIDYGDAEGKDAAYLAENYPSIVDQWSKHKDPRFPNGENYEDVLHRVHKFMNICHAKPYARVMAVTHNVAIRVIIGSILDIPKHLWHKIPTEHLGSYEVILTKNNQRYINISKELLESIYSEVYN
jgi:broad specificity phosphatase PhoE